MQDLPFEELFEGLQIGIANVGDRPVVEVGVNPMDQMVTFASNDSFAPRSPQSPLAKQTD